MTSLDMVLDANSGIVYARPSAGLRAPYATGVGTVVYRCHTCGELIPKAWEAFFVDSTLGAEWASYIVPVDPPATMTSHHDWHMSEDGG